MCRVFSADRANRTPKNAEWFVTLLWVVGVNALPVACAGPVQHCLVVVR